MVLSSYTTHVCVYRLPVLCINVSQTPVTVQVQHWLYLHIHTQFQCCIMTET